jgi:phospholipase/carboxylesterase
MTMTHTDPHRDQPVLTAGPTPEEANATLILLHGRGASAQDILSVFHALDLYNLAALAPQAYNHTWYPLSFLAPLDQNQPYLDSALAKLDAIVSGLLARRIPSERIAILGFSQGACLTSEYVARHPRRYGAVIALTGGLIGPPGTPPNYPGELAGTPVLLATSDPDPHVPIERVRETERVLASMGAAVDLRRYPGMPHTINQEEVAVARTMLQRLTERHDAP